MIFVNILSDQTYHVPKIVPHSYCVPLESVGKLKFHLKMVKCNLQLQYFHTCDDGRDNDHGFAHPTSIILTIRNITKFK